MGSGTGTLWHANFKINTDERGFNQKFHLAEVDEATAIAAANDIATRMKLCLPTDAEIFYATISKDNSAKDSRFLKDALGKGSYQVPGSPAVDSLYDFPSTCLLVRFEHSDGGSVTRKFNPLPDSILADAQLLSSVAAITGGPTITVPVAGSDTWYVSFANLLATIVKKTQHVKSGHAPGGPYTYFPWQNAFVIRAGIKKGGRVFSS